MSGRELVEKVRFIVDNRSRLCTREGIRSGFEMMAQHAARLRSRECRKQVIAGVALMLLPLLALLWVAVSSRHPQATEEKMVSSETALSRTARMSPTVTAKRPAIEKAAPSDTGWNRATLTAPSDVAMKKSNTADQSAKHEPDRNHEPKKAKSGASPQGRPVPVRVAPGFVPSGSRSLDKLMSQRARTSTQSGSQFRPQYNQAADFQRQQAIMQAQEASQRAMRNYRTQTSGYLGSQGLMWVP